MKGYVYILVNSSLQNLVKIGRTTKLPQQRAQELSGTGTPGRYVVAYSLCVDDCIEVEAQIHITLKQFRHTNDREFFETDSTTAINTLLELAKGRVVDVDSLRDLTVAYFDATLYIARVSKGRNLYRVSFVQNSDEYIFSKSFQESIVSLYISYNDSFFYDCEVLDKRKYSNLNIKAFEEIKSHLSQLLKQLESKNSFIKIMAEYDLYTLNIQTSDNAVLSKITKNIFAIVDATYSDVKSRTDKQLSDKLIELQRTKV